VNDRIYLKGVLAMKKRALYVALVAAIAALLSTIPAARAADDGKTYKVFIYAGQSNARGKAPNAIMDAQADLPATKDLYKPYRKDGKWIVRDDVFFNWEQQNNGAHGPLTLGLGSYRGGSDYAFGSMMGDHFDEPVVISKSAFGGSSLCQNFRSPSAGYPADLDKQLEAARKRVEASNAKTKKNDPLPTMDDVKKTYGELYRQILADYKKVTENADTLFPELKGRKPELAGFVWFQGWNDQYGGQDEYASNLKHFITDIRKDLGAPNLPFVVVAMGQNGSTPAAGAMLTIREAQMSMQDVPEFKGNVKAFRSDVLVDKDAERLSTEKDPAARQRDKEELKKFAGDAGYHYYGSPIWYTRIGKAIGEAMLDLLKKQGK
jgi:alpha-galactosidase